MRLLLVRHGESTWNVERRVQGSVRDVPLTDRGRQQAAEAAALLAGEDAVALWSSDLRRAMDTAAPIGRALGLPVHATELLREQALGSMEGRLSSELVVEPVPEGQHIAEVRWGGGESVRDVYLRMERLVAQLRSSFAPGDTVVLVSHGDALQVLRAMLAGRDHRSVEWNSLANGEVMAVPMFPATTGQPRVRATAARRLRP